VTAALILPQLQLILPELVLVGGALALVLVGAIRGERSFTLVTILSYLLLIIALVLVVRQPMAATTAFNGAYIADGFGRFMKILTLAGSALSLAMAVDFLRREGMAKFEYPLLILLSTAGMMLMISANDLISLYLGLELQSLSLYVLAAMNRDNARSAEAGLKYFVLGALSSGMLLYGASLLYGFAGTVSFPGLAAALKDGTHIGVIFGVVFVAAGLAFKMSAVPFHMWTPDVYEGAPTPVTAFFASAPKVAAVALTLRVFIDALPGLIHEWQQIIVFMAIASMVLGSFAAIGQGNIKRLLAYSSIGHVGFALIGLATGTVEGVQAVLVYMAIYVMMTVGVFACVLSLRTSKGLVEGIDRLGGLSKAQPLLAFCLAMMMFSLAGIPWLAGFFAKFYVLAAAVKVNMLTLAVIAVLASTVAAYYYLRVVKVIYFDEPQETFVSAPLELKVIMVLTTLLVFLFWLAPGPLLKSAHMAAKSLF
jgi:NADH-quinone oxidoreductase subunit N